MMTMRSNAPLKAAVILVCGVALASCAPKPPSGVNEEALWNALGDAVGDPNTCVVLAQAKTGKVIWKYQALNECGRDLPTCSTAGNRTAIDLAKLVAGNGASVTEGCSNVSWAAGPTPRTGVVYSAVMQGGRALPGMIIADKLENVFKATGF